MSGARLEAKKIESAKDNEVLQYENSKRSWVSYRRPRCANDCSGLPAY